MPCDLFSLSPKLANPTPWKRAAGKFAPRHEALRLNFSVIQSYVDNYDYQLKLVVAQRADFDEIERILAAFEKRRSIARLNGARGHDAARAHGKGQMVGRALQAERLRLYATPAHRAIWQSARHVIAREIAR